MALFWYLDFLTYGRGAFLAMLFALFCVSLRIFFCFSRRLLWAFLFDQILAFGVAAVAIIAVRATHPFSQMAGRFALDLGRSESGRWQILLHWFDSWINTSIFWGQGWGVIPGNMPMVFWSKDPHNIYAQILCDGGIWAVLIVLICLLGLWQCASRSSSAGSSGLGSVCGVSFGSSLLVYQGVDRIWAISSGLWIILACCAFFSGS